MRILGIDPGSTVTGYGVIEGRISALAHRAHGTLRFPKNQPQHERLASIYQAVTQWVEDNEPDSAAVEKIFVSANPRSALTLGQARGAALAALGNAGVPVFEYAPQALKRSVTGNGAASKRQVQGMVRRLLQLETTPAADAADALALALCHAQSGTLAALGVDPAGAGAGSGRRGRRGAGRGGGRSRGRGDVVVRRLR